MKNATKSILAALSLVFVLAACNKTEKPADVVDSTAVQTDTVQTVAPDTTATTVDTTATAQ